MHGKFKVGDHVEVTVKPYLGQLGKIVHINGGYINVRMKKTNHVAEYYANELKGV